MIPLPEPESEDTSSLVLEDLSDDLPEEEPKTEEFNGVEVDEQLNPVDEMEDGEEEIDTELSFGQQAFAKAKEFENDDNAKIEIQEVEVEKPRSFWGWLVSLFTQRKKDE